MTKQLFTLLVLLGAGAASVNAQNNTATVNQSGNTNSATVGQSGQSNAVTANQTGTSTATVTQTGTAGGTGNDVLLDQNASSATISQTGNGNWVLGDPQNNALTAATQSGGSTLQITQVSAPAASDFAGNSARVIQKDGANGTINQNSTTGPGSRAALWQDGASTALIDQTNLGTAHVGRIYQFGDDNNSSILQYGGVGSNARLDTYGDGNTAHAKQDGTSHIIVGVQSGNGNDLTINQDGPFSGQLTNIVTTGNDNNAKINQSVGTMDGGPATWNEAVITVNGHRNDIDIDQMGEDNRTYLTQTGNDHDFKATQTGVNNRVFGLTGETAALQSGSLHQATLSQTGSDHLTRLSQTGSGNVANVTQN